MKTGVTTFAIKREKRVKQDKACSVKSESQVTEKRTNPSTYAYTHAHTHAQRKE